MVFKMNNPFKQQKKTAEIARQKKRIIPRADILKKCEDFGGIWDDEQGKCIFPKTIKIPEVKVGPGKNN